MKKERKEREEMEEKRGRERRKAEGGKSKSQVTQSMVFCYGSPGRLSELVRSFFVAFFHKLFLTLLISIREKKTAMHEDICLFTRKRGD